MTDELDPKVRNWLRALVERCRPHTVEPEEPPKPKAGSKGTEARRAAEGPEKPEDSAGDDEENGSGSA